MRCRILLKQSWTLSLSVSHSLQVLVDTFSVSVVLFPGVGCHFGLSVNVALFPLFQVLGDTLSWSASVALFPGVR